MKSHLIAYYVASYFDKRKLKEISVWNLYIKICVCDVKFYVIYFSTDNYVSTLLVCFQQIYDKI